MSVNKTTYCLLGVALLVLLSSRAFAVQVSIGEESIQVPAPAGFANVTEVSREQFDLFSDMLPETNRLHAVFVSEGDTGLLLKGEEAELDQYFLVQSVKSLDELTLSKSQFSELRTILRNEYASTFQKQSNAIAEGAAKVGEALSSRYGTEVEFNISGVATLGIDEESVSHIMMSFLSKYDVQAEEESTEHVVAGTMIVALINGKVLYLNVYRTYQSDEDIQWTRSQAKNWLPFILAANQRPWPLADGLIVPQGTLLDSHTQELISEEQSEYRTAGHAKAQGLDLSLKYPSSWRSEEGIRPHIVQKFTGQAISGITPFCMIIVQELPAWASLFMQGEVMDEVLSENIRDMVPPGADVLDSGLTKLDGEAGAWLKYYYAQERAGMNVGMYSLQYILFYRGTMIAIQCSVGGVADEKDLLEDAFLSHLPLFQSIGNSIVLHDKWNNPSSTGASGFMQDSHGEFWWFTLLISALLTWGIGLAPPLLIRYLFARHPFSKRVSLGFVAGFWFLNILIFTAMGSESKTHAALFLVALASYYILHRGYSIKEHGNEPDSPDARLSTNPACANGLMACDVDESDHRRGANQMRVHVKPMYQPQQSLSIEDINAMLERGELDGDEPAWRPGLEKWTVLGEIEGVQVPKPPPLLASEKGAVSVEPFSTESSDSEPSPFNELDLKKDPVLEDQSKTFLGGTTHPWRRFFARTVDVTALGGFLFICLAFCVGYLFPQNAAEFAKAIENPIIAAVVIYLLWIPFEATFLALAGTTPAKWLFGIRVLDSCGAYLSWGTALQRTFLVFIQGEGLGIPLVTLFTQIFAYRRLTKTGTTLWDASVNSIVTHRRWGFFRALFCVLAVIAVLMFLSVLNAIPTQY